MMNYGFVIKDAWHVAWHKKMLWLFGLGACISVIASGIATQAVQLYFDGPAFFRMAAAMIAMVTGLDKSTLLLLSAIVLLFGWLVGTFARIGLIHVVTERHAVEPSALDTLPERKGNMLIQLFATSVFPIWGMKIVLWLAGICLYYMIFFARGGFASFAPRFPTLSTTSGIILSLITAFLIGIIALTDAFAYRSIVAKQRGPIEGIRHALQLIRDHIASILILIFIYTIFLVLGFLVAILALLFFSFLLFTIVALILAMTGAQGCDPAPVGSVATFICSAETGARLLGPTAIAGLLAYSFISTYQSALFTVAYEELSGEYK